MSHVTSRRPNSKEDESRGVVAASDTVRLRTAAGSSTVVAAIAVDGTETIAETSANDMDGSSSWHRYRHQHQQNASSQDMASSPDDRHHSSSAVMSKKAGRRRCMWWSMRHPMTTIGGIAVFLIMTMMGAVPILRSNFLPLQTMIPTAPQIDHGTAASSSIIMQQPSQQNVQSQAVLPEGDAAISAPPLPVSTTAWTFTVEPKSVAAKAKEELLQKCKTQRISVAPQIDTNATDYHPQQQGRDSISTTIWVPGFPGSGSELFRKLISAMTGLPAGDIYESSTKKCSLYPATCKTHCPFLQPSQVCPSDRRLKVGCKKACEQPVSYRENYFDENSWLLLRNPKNALPSHENWVYEAHRSMTTHSQQMPQSAWRKVRDKNFRASVSGWANTIKWWTLGDMTNFGAAAGVTAGDNERDARLNFMPPPRIQHPYNTSLIIAYEHLTSPIHGPRLLRRIATELSKANIRVPIRELEDGGDPWPCFWAQIVLNSNSTTKRSSEGRYVPSFRRGQQDKLVAMLDELIDRYTIASPRADIVPILQYYREDIASNLKLDAT